MSKFPLIEKWMPGLQWSKDQWGNEFIGKKDLESELDKGSIVTEWSNSEMHSTANSEALLIGARPIKQETAEQKLKAEVDRAVSKAICHIHGATLSDQQRALEMVQEVFNPFLARSKA